MTDPSDPRPLGSLRRVVASELARGNWVERDWTTSGPDGRTELRMGAPLDLEALRRELRLPAAFRTSPVGERGRTWVMDPGTWSSVDGGLGRRLLPGQQAPPPPERGLRWVLGNLRDLLGAPLGR